AVSYLQSAVELFEELGDLKSLTSSLVVLLLPVGGNSQANLMVNQSVEFDKAMKSAERGLAIAREIGYRAGEAFAMSPQAWTWSSQGEMMRGLELARRAYSIAEEIQHWQWMTLTQWAVGQIYHDYFVFDQAEIYLVRALQLAQEIRSRHWISCAGGIL